MVYLQKQQPLIRKIVCFIIHMQEDKMKWA